METLVYSMQKNILTNFWACRIIFCFVFLGVFFHLNAETTYKTSTNRIRMQKNSSESLFAVRSFSDTAQVRSVYVSDKDGYTQKTYDDFMRLVVESSWKNSANDVVLETVKKYEYDSDSIRYTKTEEYVYSEKKMYRTAYNEKGLAKATSVFVLDDDGTLTQKILSAAMYQYDSNNQKIQEQQASVGKPRTRIEYSYSEYSSEPDIKKYENNELVYQKSFLNGDFKYQEKVFFEDGSCVTSVYEKNKKIEEILEIDGEIVRSRTF